MKEIYLKAYIGVLVALAVALAGSWIYWRGIDLELILVLGTVVLAGLVFLGDLFPIRVSERYTIGAWDIGLIVATVALGPTWAAIAALPSAVFVGRRDWLRTVYEVSHSVVIVYLSGLTFSLVSEPLLISNPESSAIILYGTLVSGITLLATNKTINLALLKIKYDTAIFKIWKDTMEPYLFSDILNVLTAAVGVLTLMMYGPAAAFVVVGGSVGSQVLVYRSREQVRQIGELQTKVGSLEEALTSSNTTLGTMMIEDLGRKDGYTHRHAAATAVYAADMGREMKLDERHVGWLWMAGLLHNIGLFSMPDELLLATGRLNSIAQARLAEHPARGEETLAAIPEFGEMARWIRWHHERVDGRGYPDKLRDTWIPLEAKILSVAQAYAAMVLDQPHRPGVEPAAARTELVNGIDTQFDASLVKTFLRILDTETEGYRRADDHRFAFPTPNGRREEIGGTQNIDLRVVQGDLGGEARQG